MRGGGGGAQNILGSRRHYHELTLWNMYHPHPLGPMCCLPLIRCTVHRPCCMICNRGPKEKGMGAPPGAMPILTIKSSQFQGLLCFKGTI